MKAPTDVAKDGMNRSTDDTSHVFVRDTGELWVRSVWMDEVDWIDSHKRGWHWKPDPRPPKMGTA